jgi:competence protein ComEC
MVEQRLVDNGLSQHDLLSVPHHGSATSSSRVFVDAVQPLLALVSAGWNNRFNFPRDDVIERYRKNRTPVLNTAQCGGIRVTANPGTGLRVESARLARRAIWRWPPGELCPLDG